MWYIIYVGHVVETFDECEKYNVLTISFVFGSGFDVERGERFVVYNLCCWV